MLSSPQKLSQRGGTPKSKDAPNAKTKLKIAIISSYVPKKCGIATFSRDLISGILSNQGDLSVHVIAAEDGESGLSYGPEVHTTTAAHLPGTFTAAAEAVNKLKPDVVLLQHEFGLFGGGLTDYHEDGVHHRAPLGDNLFRLLDRISAPVVTTFHTVLIKPDPPRRDIIRRLADRSVQTVAMTNDSAQLLLDDYGIPRTKVNVIPHGVPSADGKSDRSQLGIDAGDKVLMTTGLISANKGLDLAIAALPSILLNHPEAKLYVVGQTHPTVLAKIGEKDRLQMIEQAKKLGVEDKLVFINRYLPTDELVQYMQASDIYLTLHRDPQQAASGTLAYAVGAGLVCVSTPYRYAKEVLADGRGLLVPFGDAEALAKVISTALSDRQQYQKIQASAKEYGKNMTWPIVGNDYLSIIRAAVYQTA